MNEIYLDNNATTPMLPEVASAMADCHARVDGNPASQHTWGRRARRILEEAREEIATILGAQPGGKRGDRLLFTSGGTESNNLAIRGVLQPRPGNVLVSAIEHPSVLATADACAHSQRPVIHLAVDAAGQASLDDLVQHLDPNTQLVSVMTGNHETGVLQPIEEMTLLCASAGVLLHTDAVQVVGKISVNFRQLGAAMMSFSAHKLHGPVGIGGLLLRSDVDLVPIFSGGSQQLGLRPGTEPVALVVGMREALRIWQRDAIVRQQQMTQLRSRFEDHLSAEISEMVVLGKDAPRLPHTSSVAFPGLDRQAFVMALDLEGIACSSGSACTSGSSQPSPVIQAMGASPAILEGAIRFSFSAMTTLAEIDESVVRIIKVYRKLRELADRRKTPTPPPHR